MTLDKLTLTLTLSNGAIRSIDVPLGEGVAMEGVSLAAKPAIKGWTETVNEYLTWGKLNGRSDGSGWSAKHARNVEDHLTQWRNARGFINLADITTNDVERHMTALRALNKSGATCRHRFTALRSFVNWCLKREYFAKDPLLAATKPNGKPDKETRALTMAEARNLIAHAPPDRALLYLFALQTAFRQNEMRSLAPADVDHEKLLVHLKAENEKTRQDWWFPITAGLSAKLKEAGGPTLLKLTTTPIQEFDKDLARAGISKTEGGVIDFHGLRRTAITWFEEAGGTESQIRIFGRHSVRTTTQRYRRPKMDDIRAVMVKVERAFLAGKEDLTTLNERRNSGPKVSGGLAQLGERQAGSPHVDVLLQTLAKLTLSFLSADETQRATMLAAIRELE